MVEGKGLSFEVQENEIYNFALWNAHAVYFYELDNNIVELIAIKNQNTAKNRPFNYSKLIEI